MKDNNLELVYDNFASQLTSRDGVLGVYIDDNLTWTNHFQHVSKKISACIWLLFQMKLYLSLQHNCYFTMLILSLVLNIVVWFEGIRLFLKYIKLQNYREEPVN